MSIRDLITRKHRDEMPARRYDNSSLFSFQRDMNHLFDDFFRGFAVAPFGSFEASALSHFSPKVNMSESEKELTVSAELPGMDEKDISVEVDDDSITIQGERKEQSEEKGNSCYQIEQSYGSFKRVIPLPSRIDSTKAKATFRKGMLTVNMPRIEDKESRRKTIEVKAG